VQEKTIVLPVPGFRAVLVRGRIPDGADPRISAAALERLQTAEPWEATRPRRCARSPTSGEKPRNAFAPIRLVITGSKVSPGLLRARAVRTRRSSRVADG
jgi:hypothetical protein